MELIGGCGTCMKQELTTGGSRLLRRAGPYRDILLVFTSLLPTPSKPQPHPIDPILQGLGSMGMLVWCEARWGREGERGLH